MVSPRRLALRYCGSDLVGCGTTALVDRSKTEDTLTLIARHTEMSAVLAVVAASVTTFAATNIDDLFHHWYRAGIGLPCAEPWEARRGAHKSEWHPR